MKFVIYIRISKNKRTKDGVLIDDPVSMQMQLEDCIKHIGDRGPHVVYSETGTSDDPLEKRRELMNAIDALEPGDVFLCWKQDRLTRGADYERFYVKDQIKNVKKATMESVTEEFVGKDDPMSEFNETLFGGLARLELRMIRQRTGAAIKSKIARGERVGGIPYGYKTKPGDKMLYKDVAEQVVLKKMLLMRESGLSYRMIASILTEQGHRNRSGGDFDHGHINRIVKRNLAKGERPCSESLSACAEVESKA